MHGRVRQQVVTNGTAHVQHRKLAKSGIIDLMDGVFISEEMGAEEIRQGFFAAGIIRVVQRIVKMCAST